MIRIPRIDQGKCSQRVKDLTIMYHAVCLPMYKSLSNPKLAPLDSLTV